jgi:hypothetical protein
MMPTRPTAMQHGAHDRSKPPPVSAFAALRAGGPWLSADMGRASTNPPSTPPMPLPPMGALPFPQAWGAAYDPQQQQPGGQQSSMMQMQQYEAAAMAGFPGLSEYQAMARQIQAAMVSPPNPTQPTLRTSPHRRVSPRASPHEADGRF